MIELKENDWVVNILGNQHLSTADFKEAGLNAENTSLLDEDVYKRSSLITENPLFKNENGDFDNTKFHEFYKQASFMYNMLANDTYLDKMEKEQTIYGKDDIFAPKELRRTFEDTVKYNRVHNADRTTTGLIRIGETAAPKLSRDEIAQSLKVLANPVEAEKDPSKAIWHDSPNDSWFTDFFDTRVLAAWDSDGEHQDLITGETVKHKKGDLKLNENGTYYYENLDGRDVYGKLVLNKMNTLTADGSSWNKYDFFDSDDLELKSIGGSILKNAALVGSMFIPYVGPWIAGISVASQLVGLTGTLGKMFLGSDSPTLSAMEGWAKSVNRQTAKTQYALENTWCWENYINLIGDVMGQLKELRFLFEYAPAIIKGSKVVGWNGINTTKQAKFAEEAAARYKALNEAKWSDLVAARKAAGKGITAAEIKSYGSLRSAEKLMGNKDVENFMKAYLKVGETLSKGYMTAITVGDTYGEAKEAGASDLEALILTLGYAAAEYKILSSDIGKWILPELKNSGLKNRAIIKTLTQIPEEMRIAAKKKVSGAGKKELVKYWFNKGKELASDLSLAGKGLGGLIVSGGLAEGVEEVSEELLSDVVKTCYNAVQWLQGDSSRMSAWENMYDRYMMSFLGGAVGGGLTTLGTEFKMNNEEMTQEKAVLELVYMIRENKEKELYRTLDKMTLANPYLLNEVIALESSDGKSKSMIFKPATSESSNMDLDIKKAFKLGVEVLKRIINSEGLKISDSAFLDKLTFNDIKLAALQESPVASLYLLDFNTLCTKIIGVKNEINALLARTPDGSKPTDAETEDLLKRKNEELEQYRLQKEAYLNGDLAMDYVGKALFDLTPIFSKYFHYSFFKDYVKYKYDKKLSELSEDLLKSYREEFEVWKNSEHKNDVSVLAPLYLEMARNSGAFIQEFAKNYDRIRKNTTLLQLIGNRLTLLEAINIQGIEPEGTKVRKDVDLNEWISSLSDLYLSESADTALALIYNYGSKKTKDRIKTIIDSVNKLDKTSATYNDDLKALNNTLTNTISFELVLNLDAYFDEFITTGAINPEIKHSLLLVLVDAKAWINLLKDPIKNAPDAKKIITDNEEEGINGRSINENTLLADLLYLNNEENKEEISEDITKFIQDVTIVYNQLGFPPKLQEQVTLKDYDLVRQKLDEMSSKMDLKMSAIDSVAYTDVIGFIQNYIQTNSDSKLDIAKLLDTVNGILDLNITNLESAILDGSIDQINEGIEVIGWLQGLVLGAQFDSDANLDNLAGYNVSMNEIAKKNHVKDYIPLPTIAKEDALIIDLDLELIKNKLLLAKAIYSINQGKKLILQDTVSINNTYIRYNRLKKFIVNIGDEWKEKNKLEEALKNAEVLKKYAESRDLKSLSDNDKIALEKEKANIEDAIFDFFNNADNLKRIQDGELYTLFLKGIDLYSNDLKVMDADTKLLDDRTFLWYLASRASIKRSGFYNVFKLVINDEVIPIPTLEEAIFLNVAFILNGDMFNAFREAYIKATLEDFNKSSEAEKRRILKDRFDITNSDFLTKIINSNNLINENLFPIYSNIFLTEGIPGAGKSKAVSYYVTLVINKVLPNIMEKAWVAHNTKSKAEELAKSFSDKVGATHDKKSLMTTIYSDYNTGREKDILGNYIYDNSDWVRDPKTNQIVYKYKSDDMAKENVPSLIIIDEVSHYDLADLLLLNDFARKYGIPIITFGDFEQSSSTAVSRDNWEDFGRLLEISPKNTHFMGSPKLGVSMRTSNTQMDKTITSFRSGTEKVKLYYYLDNTIGINGVKRDEIKEVEADIKLMISTLKPGEKIGLIYYDAESPILKVVNEKYSDKFELFEGNSALGGEGLYYVVDAFGSDAKDNKELRRDIYTAVTRASLGVILANLGEKLYVLSILENVTMDSSYSKTGLANYFKKRKTLLDTVYTSDDKLDYTPRKAVSISTPPPAPPVISITPPVAPAIPPVIRIKPIEAAPPPITDTTPPVTDTVPPAEPPVTDKEPPAPDTVPPPPVEPPAEPPTSGSDSIFEDERDVRIIKDEGIDYYTDGTKVAKEVKGYLEVLADDDPKAKRIKGIYNNLKAAGWEYTLPDETSDEAVLSDINALNEGQSESPISTEGFNFTYLLHSHNTFELGVKDNDGKIEFFDSNMERYLYRIDSVIGLMKIFEKNWKKPTNSIKFYTNIILLLRGYLFGIPEKSDLMLALSSIFNPDGDEGNPNLDVIGLEFGLISSPNISKRSLEDGLKWGNAVDRKEYGVFDKNVDEITTGNGNPDPEAKRINRKSINAIITLRNGKRVAIPLFVLGSLETYTRNPENPVSEKLAELHEIAGGDAYKFHKLVTEDKDLQKIPEIYNLAKLYLFTNGAYFKIDDETWTPAKDLKNWGIQVNTEAISGKKLPYHGEPISVTKYIEESKLIFSKQVYTSQQLLVDSSNNIYDFAHIGHPFVLVTLDPRLDTDEKMQELYERLILDPSILKTVTLVYIAPPTVPIRTYLLNLFELINEKDPDKRINIKKLGSHLTSYYIWKRLLPELKSGSLSTKLDTKTKEKIILEVERLNAITDKQLLLNEVMANQEWEGVNTGLVDLSVLKHLNYALLSLFLDLDGNIIPENLNTLVSIIEGSGLTKIYYSTKFKNKVPPKDQVMVPLESDLSADGNTLYSINGLSFTVTGKLDSCLFSSKDLNPIIESFVNKIVPPSDKNPRETSSDTYKFIHPKTPTETPSKGTSPKTDEDTDEQIVHLDENSLGIDSVKVLIIGRSVAINGHIRPLDESEYFQVFTKDELKQDLKSIFGPLEFNIDPFYDLYIKFLVENELYFRRSGKFLNLIWDTIETLMLLKNQDKDSTVKYYFNSLGLVCEIKFKEEDLNKFGLLHNFVINDTLTPLSAPSNNEGIKEYKYDENTIIRINERTNSAEIIREGKEEVSNDKWDNAFIDSNLHELLKAVDAEDLYTRDILNYVGEGDPLSNLKGNQDIIEDLLEVLDSLDKNDPNYKELNELKDYLSKKDSESCNVHIKSI